MELFMVIAAFIAGNCAAPLPSASCEVRSPVAFSGNKIVFRYDAEGSANKPGVYPL